MDPSDSANLADLVIALDPATRMPRAASFREEALRHLRERVPFDAALWAAGHLGHDGPSVTASRLLARPPEMLAQHAAMLAEDPLARACVREVGAGCVHNHQAGRIGVSRAWLDFVARWRLTHAMGCFIADPVTGLFSGVALWREREDAGFTGRERVLFEALVPQLAAAWERARIARLLEADPGHGTPAVHGIADPAGALLAAPPAFQKALIAEFPRWSGGRLPGPLVPLAAEGGRYEGARCDVTATPRDGRCLVEIRIRPAAEGTVAAA